jgi:hypothetical protein
MKKVKPSVCLAQVGNLPPSEYLTGMVHDTRTYEKHGQRVTVWNATFSDFPGGPQDHEETLMKAIECYAQFKVDACQNQQVSSHDMTTVSCKEGSSHFPPVSISVCSTLTKPLTMPLNDSNPYNGIVKPV